MSYKDDIFLVKNLTKPLFDFEPDELADLLRISNYTIVYWEHTLVYFEYDKNLVHPTEGSAKLLGGENSVVCIKSYSVKEFCELLKGATKIGINIQTLDNFSGVLTNIDYIRNKRILDGKKTLDDLENAGLITTRNSINALAIDDRKFEFTKKSIGLSSGIANYIGNEYEADCFGSSFCQELTLIVIELWENKSILK